MSALSLSRPPDPQGPPPSALCPVGKGQGRGRGCALDLSPLVHMRVRRPVRVPFCFSEDRYVQGFAGGLVPP